MNKLLHYRDYLENFYIEVPCGKCYLCRKKKANGWRIRLVEECKSTPKFRHEGVMKYRVIFVLFTYDDDHLPNPGNRSQFAEHIRKWRDLWRKKYGKSPRYFAVTDKGSQFGRLHLHLLIFNPYDYKYNRNISIEELETHGFFWRNGMVRQPSWLESMRGITYVTGYITGSNLEKDSYKHGKPICKESLEYNPFVFVSNGLGSQFLEGPNLVRDDKNANLLYNFNGYNYALPSYYRYKIFDDDTRWHANLVRKYEKNDYVLFSDDIKYSFHGVTYDYQGLERLYNSSYSRFDIDYNKKIKMLYAK